MNYYDRQGDTIALAQFAELFENNDYKRVAYNLLDNGNTTVSTVWLGIDHNFGTDGPPIIFETMIFGGRYDQGQWRYPTESAALAGHHRIVTALREGRSPA